MAHHLMENNGFKGSQFSFSRIFFKKKFGEFLPLFRKKGDVYKYLCISKFRPLGVGGLISVNLGDHDVKKLENHWSKGLNMPARVIRYPAAF